MRRISGIAIVLLFISISCFSQEKVKPKQPDLPDDLVLDFGFNFLNKQPESFPSHFWGSNSVGIYYNKRYRINDYIAFHPSVGFTFEKYSFNSKATWLRDEDGIVSLDSLPNVSFEKNKLVTNWIEVPLEFRIHPLKTVKGEGWFIGLGGVVGYNIGAHTKIKFHNGDNEVKEKLYDGIGLEPLRYGLQARLGFKTFHVFYKTYLNNMFKTAPDDSGINPKAFTIGVTFSGF